jgi:hypothetical protein
MNLHVVEKLLSAFLSVPEHAVVPVLRTFNRFIHFYGMPVLLPALALGRERDLLPMGYESSDRFVGRS